MTPVGIQKEAVSVLSRVAGVVEGIPTQPHLESVCTNVVASLQGLSPYYPCSLATALLAQPLFVLQPDSTEVHARYAAIHAIIAVEKTWNWDTEGALNSIEEALIHLNLAENPKTNEDSG